MEVEKSEGNGSAGVSGGSSKEVSDVRKVTYESRQYLVVPPGYSFCSFTNNTSVNDNDAPTGFKWVCYLPRFVQIKGNFENVPCTTAKNTPAVSVQRIVKLPLVKGFPSNPSLRSSCPSASLVLCS